MELQLIQKLNRLNSQFYAQVASSFSNTRQSAWQGWDQVICVLAEHAREQARVHAALHAGEEPCPNSTPYCVADIACGNLRFEKHLLESLPQDTRLDLHAFDNCPDLMALGDLQDLLGASSISLQELDILQTLIAKPERHSQKQSIFLDPGQTPFNAALSFGFMHHIPSSDLRRAFLQELAASVVPGGLIVLSFWQFMKQERLAAKAASTIQEALQQGVLSQEELSQFEAGDYLLPWQDVSGIYRYCHHFSDKEIKSLCEDFADILTLCSEFQADGRQGNLNHYCIFELNCPNTNLITK